MTPDLSTERAILDLLSDEDGDYHLGQALTLLLDVVAVLCLEGAQPGHLASEFAVKMQRRVAGGIQPRPLS